MSQEHEAPIARTSPGRTAKMMAIMLGICIVGGGIFFGMWDYWISSPAPVVAMMSGSQEQEQGVATGKTINVDLRFVESDDFTQLAFNALPDEEGNNPTIEANVGDRIVFNVENAGVSFHAFGVTTAEEGFTGIIPGTEIGSMSSPLSGGQGGTSEFVPSEEGTYYYICTVPGHREQGMVGQITVGSAEDSSGSTEAAAPTGVSHNFELDFVESDDFTQLAFNALPGEEGNNPTLKVNSGDEVTISVENKGVSFHAFGITSDPEDFNNTLWGSEIASMSNPLSNGDTGQVTFNAGAPGTYYYICTIPGHALQGMQGQFIVE